MWCNVAVEVDVGLMLMSGSDVDADVIMWCDLTWYVAILMWCSSWMLMWCWYFAYVMLMWCDFGDDVMLILVRCDVDVIMMMAVVVVWCWFVVDVTCHVDNYVMLLWYWWYWYWWCWWWCFHVHGYLIVLKLMRCWCWWWCWWFRCRWYVVSDDAILMIIRFSQ